MCVYILCAFYFTSFFFCSLILPPRFCWLIQLESAEIEIDWHFVIVVGRCHSFRFIKLSPVVNCWWQCYKTQRATVKIFFERYVRHTEVSEKVSNGNNLTKNGIFSYIYFFFALFLYVFVMLTHANWNWNNIHTAMKVKLKSI